LPFLFCFGFLLFVLLFHIFVISFFSNFQMSNCKGNRQGEDKEEVPALAELLVSLSTTARNTGQRDIELRNTLIALLARETLDGVPRGEYARLAILLGFKRRNHSKARASGDGDGERGFLRAVLLELYDLVGEEESDHHLAELVHIVLPLVPHYGSWRDLLVLGESSFPSAESKEDDEEEGGEDTKVPLCLSPLGRAVGQVFASQLRRDMELVMANEDLADAEKHVPSNACKYAPHEKRHTGNTTVKEGRERTKKSNKLIRANRIQRLLADEVATLVLANTGEERQQHNPRLRADYRKFLSKLKVILTAKGFVIEPLLCKRNLQAINFNSANKGSLAKNRKCLEKDPAVKAKWRKAMMSSSAAVADIDSLLEASANIVNEKGEIADASDRISSLRVMKCVESFEESRKEMQANAEALLRQVTTVTTQEIDTHMLVESMAVSVLPVVDSSGCENEEEFVSLVLAAFVTARVQGLSQVVVDGEVLPLPPSPSPSVEFLGETVAVTAAASAASRRAAAAAQRESEALATSNFFEQACGLATRVFNRDDNIDMGDDDVEFNIDGINNVRRLDYLDPPPRQC
jgi:hypothetical protein